jgi:hypothetical protein
MKYCEASLGRQGPHLLDIESRFRQEWSVRLRRAAGGRVFRKAPAGGKQNASEPIGMNARRINEQALLYKNRSVRMSPEIFKRFGLMKDSSVIKIDDYQVSCIPFDLSFSGARLLSFLTAKEVAFFSARISAKHKLSITCLTPGEQKPLSFFIPISILSLKKPEPTSPYCFIEVSFGEVPLILKELLVPYFADVDLGEYFFRTAGDEAFTQDQVKAILGSTSIAMLGGGEIEGGARFKVAYLSPRRVRLFGEYEGPPIPLGTELEFESIDSDMPRQIKGKCIEYKPFDEVPGFFFLGLEPGSSPLLYSRMREISQGTTQAAAGA